MSENLVLIPPTEPNENLTVFTQDQLNKLNQIIKHFFRGDDLPNLDDTFDFYINLSYFENLITEERGKFRLDYMWQDSISISYYDIVTNQKVTKSYFFYDFLFRVLPNLIHLDTDEANKFALILFQLYYTNSSISVIDALYQEYQKISLKMFK